MNRSSVGGMGVVFAVIRSSACAACRSSRSPSLRSGAVLPPGPVALVAGCLGRRGWAWGGWLAWREGGGYPQQARGRAGQRPACPAQDRDQGGHEERSHDGGIQQDPRAERGGHDLDVGFWPGGQGGEGEEQDERGAGD